MYKYIKVNHRNESIKNSRAINKQQLVKSFKLKLENIEPLKLYVG